MRIYLIIPFFVVLLGKAQVINIESKRFLNDTNGWVGKVDANFTLVQNTQRVTSIGANAHLQYQKNKSRFLLLNDFNYLKAGAINQINSAFFHFRYNYKLTPILTAEAFSQVQFNQILLLRMRILHGIGPRIKLVKTSAFKCYAACLYMYEYEEISQFNETNKTNRLSAYISFSLKMAKSLDLTSTTFYQPNAANFKDYRIANDSALEFEISKHLNYKVGFNFLLDTKQPIGIPNVVYNLKNGLSFRF